MKRKYFISLLPLLLTACRQEPSLLPLEFNAYKPNPVLSPGEPGSWDDYFVIQPYVIRYDSTFYMFYAGSNSYGVTSAGLASSPDGIHFTKFAGNPVLAPDGTGFDAYSAGGAVVLWQDSVWAMYYNGSETVWWGPGPYIGRATAKNLTGPWIKKAPFCSSSTRFASCITTIRRWWAGSGWRLPIPDRRSLVTSCLRTGRRPETVPAFPRSAPAFPKRTPALPHRIHTGLSGMVHLLTQ